MNPAIVFEPDGYLLNGPRLMGRQAAGDGFLRAMVGGRREGPLFCYTPGRSSAQAFVDRVRELDPEAKAGWIPADRLSAIGRLGTLYRPDHAIGINARARLRAGVEAYSICGVTHTLATKGATELIADLAVAPVMPWDAVVCTSSAAVRLLEDGLDAQADYLRWRLGGAAEAPRPQLPLIPLGVHTQDFAFDPAQRAQARAGLGLAEDETAALFAGRLAFTAKAHPFQMYRALQAVAESTGRKLVLIQAGRFPGEYFESAVRSAAETACPDVRCLYVSGEDHQAYRAAWPAADLFISLSDNLQETFGLTPIEAMAAGLPVLVTDWNGYKDTVREGEDGFRVPTWQPAGGYGEPVSRALEVQTHNYDVFLSETSTAVSIDRAALVERLTALVTDPDLRRRMGAAGQARVRELYDWSVIYRRYQDLWDELGRIRRELAARYAGAPAVPPERRDVFEMFGHYPTHHLGRATRVTAAGPDSPARHEALAAQAMFRNWRIDDETILRLFARLAEGPATVHELAERCGVKEQAMVMTVARLAKMELVALSAS